MVKILSLFIFIIPLLVHKEINADTSTINVKSVVTMGSDGVSAGFCSAFTLTKEEAQYFFNNAKQVSIRDIHDNYSFLPCFVKGDGYLNNKKCEWEIRAGGTSSITCEDQSIIMVCEDCLPTPE